MVPKRSRLSRGAFEAAFKAASRVSGVGFQALFSRGSTPKVSVVVGKKVFSSAVERNRMRRRLYTLLSRIPGGLPAGTLIILVTAKVKDAPFADVDASLRRVVGGFLSRNPAAR